MSTVSAAYMFRSTSVCQKKTQNTIWRCTWPAAILCWESTSRRIIRPVKVCA